MMALLGDLLDKHLSPGSIRRITIDIELSSDSPEEFRKVPIGKRPVSSVAQSPVKGIKKESKTRAKGLSPLRIFIASPGDVLDERDRFVRVVERLDRGLANRLSLKLKLLRWETVPPDAGRPQSVVFDRFPPESWHIFVGILWLRFGSETGEIDPNTGQPYCSGTEEEFKAAYLCRQKSPTAWPKVMFYRCIRPPADDMLHFDNAQYARVDKFFKDFAPTGLHPCLVQTYTQPEEFERLVWEHLEECLWEYCEDHRQQMK